MTDERRRQSGRVWCGLCSLVRPINCTYVATAAVVVVVLILLQIQSNPHTLIFTNRSWSAEDLFNVIFYLKLSKFQFLCKDIQNNNTLSFLWNIFACAINNILSISRS